MNVITRIKLFCLCCTLRSGLHEIPTMIRTFSNGFEKTMHADGLLTIFQECLHMYYSWKIVTIPFACMVILQSMWTGPYKYQIQGTKLFHTFKKKKDLSIASKWILDIFPGIIHMSALLENCHKSFCMHGYSPIHVERS